jgi:hypothetical protein
LSQARRGNIAGMKRSRRAGLRGAALAVVLAIGGASPAAPATATIKVKPAAVHRGKHVRVYGVVTGCGGAVTLISKAFPHTHDFAGLPAVFAPRRGDGSYSVRVRIPSTRRPGAYTISGRCGGGNIGVTRRLRVLA